MALGETEQAPTLEAHILTSLSDVTAAEWDACVPGGNPFVSHAFLSALEESGSAVAETGWLGQHVVLKDTVGRVLGAVPKYLKNHSHGEGHRLQPNSMTILTILICFTLKLAVLPSKSSTF